MTTPPTGNLSPDALGSALRDVVEFVDAAGWDQPPTLFALVETSVLAQTQPDLVDEFDTSELSPIAQEPLLTSQSGPDADQAIQSAELEHILATTSWPDAVAGCALVQEIIVLPPEAESDLDDAFEPLLADPEAADATARSTALSHPGSRAARLIAGALRDGRSLSLLQLRPDEGDDDGQIELLSHPNLAPNLVEALVNTLENQPED